MTKICLPFHKLSKHFPLRVKSFILNAAPDRIFPTLAYHYLQIPNTVNVFQGVLGAQFFPSVCFIGEFSPPCMETNGEINISQFCIGTFRRQQVVKSTEYGHTERCVIQTSVTGTSMVVTFSP